ncbi:MAG: transcription termination factor Rho, partial [Solirubrobacteraceae bacterium]|nr:transcription termination factor Rho [Solirubrobacteraceae bacterium]
MSVISRSALESSSLADLHEIASELALDGYRRLRKAELVGAIIERQGVDPETEAADAAAAADEAAAGEVLAAEANGDGEADADERPARRSRRGGR